MSTSGNTEAVRRYAAKNKDKIRERRRTAYREKEIAATRSRRSDPQKWGAVVLPGIRYRAKQSGLECTISAEDIVVPAVCPVFGTPFEFMTDNSMMKSPRTPSVDRFDNSKGYIPGNIRVVSLRANLLKKDANIEEIEKILAYMKGEVLCQQ